MLKLQLFQIIFNTRFKYLQLNGVKKKQHVHLTEHHAMFGYGLKSAYQKFLMFIEHSVNSGMIHKDFDAYLNLDEVHYSAS